MFKKTSYFIRISFILIVIVLFKTNTSLSTFDIENSTINYEIDLNVMALKLNEYEDYRLFNPQSTHVGDLTGYVYNCPKCTGRLACMHKMDLSDGTTTYVDKEYGEVHIVASSKHLSCGSIIQFESKRIQEEPIIAIVLDRGVNGNSIDLLVKSREYALKEVGRTKITYDLIRSGYNNES
jgi:hypothetical protein